ncbi:trypsin-like serine protease [Colwellia sp. MEBiC06753]
MKNLGLIAVTAMTLSSFHLNAKEINPVIQPKIVGGQPATSGDWPWMSALVYTNEQIDTDLRFGNDSFDSAGFNYTPTGNVTGELVDCGIGDNVCSGAQNKVCLIERGEINFSVKAENCQTGGGVGAIIYNNEQGQINGTLGDEFSGTIPVIAVTQQVGQQLLSSYLGKIAEVSVEVLPIIAQDSFCGATFIGDKWVLTAAHCLDEANLSQLKVNVGEYDLSDGAENAIAVKRAYMHPDFDNISLDYDMALIELVTAVDTPAISLATKATVDAAAANADPAIVMGWGGRVGYEPGEGPTGSYPDVLHQVELQLMTNQRCKTVLANSLFGSGTNTENTGITERMICADVAAGGKSSCQGDSGGPLVINTNEGWQQVGVVSWGYGCAAKGYPGVFARISEFQLWIQSITQGIAVDQLIDLHVVPVSSTQEFTVTLTNNTLEDAQLSFQITGDDEFSITSDSSNLCQQLAAGDSCELAINFLSSAAGQSEATLQISSLNGNIAASQSRLVANAISSSAVIENALMSNSDVTWFSGGNKPWQTSVTGDIESGNITHEQQSIVMAVINGEGEISFEWSVSSEENVDAPEDPYDALYLYINGEQYSFISGEVEFTSISLNLTGEENYLTWIYYKDPAASEGEDKGYLRNIQFTPKVDTPDPTPTPTPSPTPDKSSSSSGGSMFWLSIVAVIALFRKRVNFS